MHPAARRVVALCVIAVAGIALHQASRAGAEEASLSEPVVPFVFRGDLRLLPAGDPALFPEDAPEGGLQPGSRAPSPEDLAAQRQARFPDPLAQLDFHEGRGLLDWNELSAPILNFDGPAGSLDPNGDVGPNHYVQMVNFVFQIYDKQGTPLLPAPPAINSLWSGAGGPCELRNDGDPIVVYDHLADRWLLSQFARGRRFAECIAISRGPDPVSDGYFLYEFAVPGDQTRLPDYPKLGVWPDAYYMSSYEGTRLGAYAFDRAAMLNGDPAQVIEIVPQLDSLTPAAGVRRPRILPSELDGPTPPDGSPNFFVRTVETQQDTSDPTDRIEIFEFSVDFDAMPPTGSFALTDTLAPAAYALVPCAPGLRDCIPQPGTTRRLDALTDRAMWRAQYRNFGSYEAIVFNQTVDADGNGNAGIRWYELRRTPPGSGGWAVHQQGTYAPQASGVTDRTFVHRWMGSLAMDRAGNLALGYTAVNSDDADPIYAGLRYTGRLSSEPLGLMPQGEQIIRDGDMAQTIRSRWGDYSAMTVDPTDGCTFWYTGNYVTEDPAAPRQVKTRIASFEFTGCRNQPPVADAGDDQVVEWTGGGVQVTLDGSGSFDPNGDALLFTWTGDFLEGGGVVDGELAVVTFDSLGTFEVMLTVEDPEGLTDDDAVAIAVEDTTPPQVACVETTNPHGRRVPRGKNPDGFYELVAVDACDAAPLIWVSDRNASGPFGPFATGDRVKITKAPGSKPSAKPMGSSRGRAGAIGAHLRLRSDAIVTAVDASGNVATATCQLPPPTKGGARRGLASGASRR